MDRYLVGVFDSIRGLASVLDRFSGNTNISIIAPNQPDVDTDDRLVDDEETTTMLDHELRGTAVTSMWLSNTNYHTLPDTNIGDLITSGPMGDQLEIIYQSDTSSVRGAFADALAALGFDQDHAIRYQDVLSQNQALVFIPISDGNENITDVLEESGSLFTETVNLDPNKTRKL